ncbi:unnamed protein product [Acanthoscelides obtectus]|uniref:Kinesin motor domain-containing protein n=1 Tax=Acanthoscelides obtectus TaxID=200917 RepID=A0A9P0L922_ACAOB|nr:unnamed protein product [Acanthoscelides obtectus]CAK1658778.1 Kinesin-like protein KIF20A [Acanthoscelides obtectus]
MSSGNMQLYAEVSSMRLSYLRARDPSIINFNAPRLPLPVNLENRYSDDDNNKIDKEAEEEEERSDHLSVFLRIKNGVPFKDLYEIDGCNLVCNSPEGSYSTRNMKVGNQLKKIYTFTKIFGPEDRQVDVFNYMVKPKVLRFINGQNSTLFTYGVSGSGKTFTIVGTADEPGIIPRALEYIFRTIKGVGFKDDIKPLPAQQVRQMSKEEVLNASRDKATLLNASFLDKHFHAEQYRLEQAIFIRNTKNYCKCN